MKITPEAPRPATDPLELSFLARESEPADAVVFGASGGIGAEFVHRLSSCRQVGRIFATSRRPDRLSFPSSSSVDITTLPFDPAAEASVRTFGQSLRTAQAAPRIVIWAGGLLHHEEIENLPERRLSHVSLRGLEETFRANAFGPLLALREIVPLLPRRSSNRIGVLTARVGSIGDNRLGGWVSYRSSKAAAHQMVRTTAIELARSHKETALISLHPGTVDTPLSRPFQKGVRHDIFTPDALAGRLLVLLDSASVDDSGSAFAWDGTALPW